MTATQDRDAALICARINATALRLGDKHASTEEAVSELRRVATERYVERHGRRSAQRTRLRLDLLQAEADLLASSPQTGAAQAQELLVRVAELRARGQSLARS